jgi:UDP-glucose 4-epimerase
MKKIILITGAAGMVGSNLIRKYINQDVQIVGIDSLKLGKLKYIKSFQKKKNFLFFKIDLSKKIKNRKIENILKKNYLHEVWHLAANSDIQNGISDYEVDLKDTFLTTINTLNFINKYLKKNTKFIFSSSSAIYGYAKGSISENYKKKNPISNYGLMKLYSEEYIEHIANKNNLKAYIFRFPNVIGNNLTHGIIYDFIKKISNNKKILNVLGNGNQQKPYSDVLEIIKCMIFIKNKKFLQKINYFNIGTNDKGIKVRDIVNIFLNETNYGTKAIFQKKKQGWEGDVVNYSYSTKKIHKLGFRFKLSSKQVITKIIKNLIKMNIK